MSNYESNQRGGRGGRGRRSRGRRARGCSRGGYSSAYTDFDSNWEERIKDFEEMDLNYNLFFIISSYGFRYPNEIQSLAIKPILLGRNVIAQAPCRSGKTSTLIIGILNSINTVEKTTQALVLSPTKEKADQISDLFKLFGMRINGLQIAVIKESESEQQQKEQVAHIIVATPDCALSHINKGFLACEDLKIACLDDTDELFCKGFNRQVEEIFLLLKQDAQKLLFSTKITPEIFDLIDQFMYDPVKINVKERLTLEGIRQFFVSVEKFENKLSTLFNILGKLSTQRFLVYVNAKNTVNYLQEEFEKANFVVSAIYVQMEQNEIKANMDQFNSGRSRVLIATDFVNYIEFPHFPHVINFELPSAVERYLHRVANNNNCCNNHVVINICDNTEMKMKNCIQIFYNIHMDEFSDESLYLIEGSQND